MKKAVPDMFISASGPSYLRQYSDLYAAGAVEEGLCDNMLFGRMSFADPAFPKQIMESGRIDPLRPVLPAENAGISSGRGNLRDVSSGMRMFISNTTGNISRKCAEAERED